MTLEERRQRILSKVRGVRPINPEAMRRGISAVSGADADVKDFSSPYSFSVTMNVTNKPIPMERVLRFIYETKPAHLAVSVEVIFPTIESALHIGGVPGAIARLGVPQGADEYDFRHTLHTGGTSGIRSTMGMGEDTSPPKRTSTLHVGGTAAAHASLSVPVDPSPPPSTTILRTGGVCTIISNLSKGE